MPTGTDRAPGIIAFAGSHSDAEFATLVRTGRLDKGMPKFDFNDAEMKALVTYVHGPGHRFDSACCGTWRPGVAAERVSSRIR